MKKSKLLLEPETIIRTKVDNDTLYYFIKIWQDFCPTIQSPKELAESVSNEFQIECSEDDVIQSLSIEISLEDTKIQMKNLNLYQ
jgi:hypothetical protein